MESNSLSAYRTQVRFYRALAAVKSLPTDDALGQPSATERLSLYALYKQACYGDCNTIRPSSRLVVEHAKWKAWDRLKGLSPIEAQQMYINGIIELLVEFINRYPEHRFAQAWAEALHYLETGETPKTQDTSETEEDQEVLLDAVDYEQDQDYLVTNIDPQDLPQQTPSRRQSYMTSPPSLSIDTRHRRYTSSEVSSSLVTTSSSSRTMYQEYPHTPDIYPSPYRHISAKAYLAQPMHILPDLQDDPTRAESVYNVDSLLRTENSHSCDSALETLQTEVIALSEQIDRMRRSFSQDNQMIRQRTSFVVWLLGFLKTVAKHTILNSLIMTFAVVLLWQRQSPLAYAILDYIQPSFQSAARRVLQRVVQWRVAV